MFFWSHSSHCSGVKLLEMPFSTRPLKTTVGETWMPTNLWAYESKKKNDMSANPSA